MRSPLLVCFVLDGDMAPKVVRDILGLARRFVSLNTLSGATFGFVETCCAIQLEQKEQVTLLLENKHVYICSMYVVKPWCVRPAWSARLAAT